MATYSEGDMGFCGVHVFFDVVMPFIGVATELQHKSCGTRILQKKFPILLVLWRRTKCPVQNVCGCDDNFINLALWLATLGLPVLLCNKILPKPKWVHKGFLLQKIFLTVQRYSVRTWAISSILTSHLVSNICIYIAFFRVTQFCLFSQQINQIPGLTLTMSRQMNVWKVSLTYCCNFSASHLNWMV